MFRWILAVLIVAPMVFAAEYDAKAIQSRFSNAKTSDDYRQIADDVLAHTQDVVVWRTIQDAWVGVDSSGASAYFHGLADKQPTQPLWFYLNGRYEKSFDQKILLGTRSITLDPKFAWAYRLTCSALSEEIQGVIQDNTFGTDAAHTTRKAKLNEVLKDRGGDFLKLTELQPEYPAGHTMYIGYLAYTGDLERGKSYLTGIQKSHPEWLRPSALANVYGTLAMVDELATLTQKMLEDEAELTEQQRTDYLISSMVSSLGAAGHYKSAKAWLKGRSDVAKSPAGQLFTGIVMMALGDQAAAWNTLSGAAKAGFDDISMFESEDIMKQLRAVDEAKFVELKNAVAANYQGNSGKRYTAVMASKIDRIPPEWSLVDAKGDTVSLASLKGKIVVLDFWATWCGPCRMAMPVLNDFTRSLKRDDVLVFSINVWEDARPKAIDFMKSHDYAMRLLFGNNDLTKAYGITGIPYLCVIDREGHLRFEEKGYSYELREKLPWWIESL